MTHAQIIDGFRAKISDIKHANPNVDYSDTPPDAAGAHNLRGNKIVAGIDSITSNLGMVQPWKEFVRFARKQAHGASSMERTVLARK